MYIADAIAAAHTALTAAISTNDPSRNPSAHHIPAADSVPIPTPAATLRRAMVCFMNTQQYDREILKPVFELQAEKHTTPVL
jgi:hypothetical protein